MIQEEIENTLPYDKSLPEAIAYIPIIIQFAHSSPFVVSPSTMLRRALSNHELTATILRQAQDERILFSISCSFNDHGYICKFLDENDYPISGCFELSTIGMESMNHWFKNNLQAVEKLIPFGRGTCGDVYCLWLTQGLQAEEAPVVMFGSEGELSVLAKNAKEFCKLLCLGYPELRSV